MEAVQEPIKIQTQKPTYRQAIKQFDLWGKVVKERVLSGDLSALPSFGGLTNSGGGSSPSDPSSMLLAFVDVDTFLATHAHPLQKSLAAFIHVWGVEEMVVSVIWVFADGTRSDPLDPSEPAPTKAVTAEPNCRRRQVYDLKKFEWPYLDQIAGDVGMTRESFLLREHKRLLRLLTQDKGLDPG